MSRFHTIPLHVSVLAALMMAAACTVEQPADQLVPPEEEQVTVSPGHTTFTAMVEPFDTDSPAATETRVYSDASLRILWEAGDRISIFNKESINREYKYTGKTGEQTCTYAPVDKDYNTSGVITLSKVYALYPYKEKTTIDSKGIITYQFPAEQTWREGTIGRGANAMVAISDDDQLRFKNLGGLLALSLYGEGIKVSSISLQGNNGEPLAGPASVTAIQNGDPSMALNASKATKVLTLTCPEPVSLGATAAKATQFWLIVPPTDFSKGFTITVTAPNGTTFVKNTDKSISFRRNKVTRMAAVQVKLQMATVPIPEKVDMKTTSGAQWGSFNVGASKPEEYGEYYAWGETEAKSTYTWDNYKYGKSKTSLTKYNTLSANGTVDYKRRLESQDDVAKVKIGGKWRMPTMEEQNELLDASLYTWTWKTKNNVAGYEVKSKSNGNSIFIPAAGFSHDGNVGRLGTGGDLWSDTLFSGNDSRYPQSGPWDSFSLLFSSTEHAENQGSLRYYGRSVRPVYGDKPVSASSVTLSKTSVTLKVGATTTLTATVAPSDVTYKGVVWSSDDTSIATVTQAGVVKGVKSGTVKVRAQAKYGWRNAVCTVTVSTSGIEAVDLGLSSGVKWAACNVNASKPEANGSYYAWAETSPKSDYSYNKYKWLMFDLYTEGSTYSKYRVVETEYGTGTLAPDGKKTLELDDDAARAVMGDKWRMPTKTEMEELVNSCTWTWTTVNNVKGYKVTSKKSGNTNYIFLPAIGYKSGESLKESGSTCAYWTSSLGTTNSKPYSLKGTSSSKAVESAKLRYYGLPVRAVCK